MKVYKIELLFIDHEDIEEESLRYHLEDCEYINPIVMNIEQREIGEWYEEHPLNYKNSQKEEYNKLFK